MNNVLCQLVFDSGLILCAYLGAQKNRLIGRLCCEYLPVLACYIGPKSAHAFSCFILNNFKSPSAHAFTGAGGGTDVQIDRQIGR